MTVSLISITPDAEELIAYLARVSNKDAKPGNPADRLIRYLSKHKDVRPFEMAHMVVEIETTRAISPQILRHRSFSFQEFSQRYAVADLGEFEIPELRRQDTKNRQNSIDDLPEEIKSEFQMEIEDVYDTTQRLYERLLSYGVAKECARGILPLNTPTKLYMAGSIRSWIHYIQLRSGNGTQEEHRRIAVACGDLLRSHLPNVYSAAFDV